MSHDPMCVELQTDYPCKRCWEIECECLCICDIIAKVRKDQTQRCIDALEALPVITHTPVAHPHEGCSDPTIHMIWTPVIALPDILTALQALQEKL